jgi:antirestriction protein ArdC
MASAQQYEAITATIIKALEGGTVPWRQPWSQNRGSTNQPHNAHSGRPYRGLNPFTLLMVQASNGYQSNGWATYHQVNDMGGQVRKGEKATLVYFWKFQRTTDSDTGKITTYPIMRMYRVFNIDQTENCALPLRETLPVDETTIPPIAAAQAILDNYVRNPNTGPARFDQSHETGNGPRLSFYGDSAFYQPRTDKIVLPARDHFKDAAGYYATAFHEAGHSTGHSSRLDRFDDEQAVAPFGSADYSKEELVAEFTSAFLCMEAGIDSTLDNAAAYIESWLRVLRNDPQMVVQGAGQAQRAADLILAAEGGE